MKTSARLSAEGSESAGSELASSRRPVDDLDAEPNVDNLGGFGTPAGPGPVRVRIARESVAARARRVVAARADRLEGAGSAARLRFIEGAEGAEGALSILDAKTRGNAATLGAITVALFDVRVQIVRCEAKSVGGEMQYRFHLAEFDGGPLSRARWIRIQSRLLEAVELGDDASETA